MWSSLFIIDPVFSAGLIGACVVAWIANTLRLEQRTLVAGLAFTLGYLGLSQVCKWRV